MNGSWQAGKDVGWTYDPGATGTSWPAAEGRAGGMCVRFDPGAIRQKVAYANGRTTISTSPGKKYRYSCWYRSTPDFNGTSGNSKMRLANQNGELIGGATFFVADKAAWTYLSAVYAIPDNTSITGLQLGIYADNTAGTLWVDDVVLEEVTELLANAQAISDLSTKVTQQGETITSQAGLLTALRSDLTNVSGKTDANASALQNLTTRVTTAEGKIESTSTSVTKLQSEMKASLAGGGGMFPSGSFEQFADGQVLSQGYGTTFTVNTSAKRNGNRGLLIQVPSDARPDLNADCYPVTEFIPLVGVRRLYIEAWAALSSGSVEIPPDNKSNLRIGVQTSSAGAGGTSNVWTTVNWGVASLSKTSWTKVSGYVTTNASAAQARLFVSLPGHATDPKSQRVIGSILLLDDIVITDVTEAYAAQQASDANAQAITGLTTRVANAEGTLTSTANQLTVLSSTVNASFNRGENLNVNAMFDGDMAPFVKGNSNQQNGDVTWVLGGGQQGSAIQMVHKAGAAGSPFVYANGGRWVPLKTGRTGRKLRTVIVARVIAGDATLTARCRVRHSAGEGNNDQTTPNLTSAWQRFVLEHPVGDDRTEAMSQVWITNRGTGDATVLVDRIEFYDVTDELLISANASATAGLTTAVNQQGSKLDATAQDLVSLKTQVGDVSASGFNQLTTQVTKQGQVQAAQAQQIGGLQVSLEDKADAAVVEQMEASIGVTGGSPNLLRNAAFTSFDGWDGWYSPGNIGIGAKYAAHFTTDGGIPWGMWGLIFVGANGAGNALVWQQDVPIEAGKDYIFSTYGSGSMWGLELVMVFLNASGNSVGEARSPMLKPLPAGGNTLSGYSRLWVRGRAPSDAVAVRPHFVYSVGPGETGGFIRIVQPQLEAATPGQTGPSAFNIGGMESKASWNVSVRSDGKVAGVRLATSNGVSAFDVVADMFRVSSSGAGQRTEYSDGNWRTYYPNGQLATRMGWWQ